MPLPENYKSLAQITLEANREIDVNILHNIPLCKNPSFSPLNELLEPGVSNVHGMGIFAKSDIKKHTDLGISHIDIRDRVNTGYCGDTIIRTGLGAFLNGSGEPNCFIYKDLRNTSLWRLILVKDVSKGDEILMDYATGECGMGYCKNVPGSYSEKSYLDNTRSKYSGCGLYMIKNIKNGKFYLGRSNDMHGRIRTHIRKLKNNSHVNAPLQNSWNKHGECSFVCKVISYCHSEFLNDLEDFLLRSLGKDHKLYAYNIIMGGSVKRSNSRKRGVLQYSLSGVKVGEFDNIKHAEFETGINRELIRGCCRKTQKKTHGYIFCFSNDFEHIDVIENNTIEHLFYFQSKKTRSKKAKERREGKALAKGHTWTDAQLKNHNNKAVRIAKYSKSNELLNVFDSIRHMRKSEGMAQAFSRKVKLHHIYFNGFMYKKV